MGTKVLQFLFPFLLATSVFAAEDSSFVDRIKVKSATVDDQLGNINPFQTDCLSLIKATNAYIEMAETYRTKKTDSFLLRVTGKTEASVKVAFATDFITYLAPNGTEKNYNFHLKKIPLIPDETGAFAFSLVLKKGQVFIPMTLDAGFKQSYELALKIGDDGKITDSLLRPIITLDTRQKLCLRSRFDISGGFQFLMYEQKVDALGASMASSSLEPGAFAARASIFKSPEQSHVIGFQSLPATLKSAQQFQGDLALPWSSINYHWQQRKLNWNSEWRSTLFQPFVHYGLQYHSLPLLKIIKADEAEVEPVSLLNASVGMGFNLIDEDSWLIEMAAHLQYPLYSSLQTRYGYMVDGGVQFYGSLGRNYYYGISWSGQLQDMSYSRDSTSLDPDGSVNLLSSVLLVSFGRLF